MLKRMLAATIVTAASLAAGQPAVAEDDPVIAIVNGQEIHRSVIETAKRGLPPEYASVPFEQIYPMLLSSLIDSKLVAADARARKMHEDEEFQERLQWVSDQLLERFAIGKVIAEELTEERLRKVYDEQTKEGALEVRARHILLKTLEDAEAVIDDLDGGADFAELAKEKSTGPSGPRGGDLGFFGAGQMVPTFEAAAFALDVGAHSDTPVKTDFGFHVIKVEERRTVDPPSFEESVESIRAELAQEVGTSYVQGLRDQATIERFNLDGSKIQ